MVKGPTEPANEVARTRQTEIERLYQEMMTPGRWVVVRHTHAWRPSTDVYENDEAIVVRVEVAGMKDSDFSVTLVDHVLVISGVRKDPYPKVVYHQMEIHYGEFRTEVYLHWAIDESQIAATYSDGILQVSLPKQLPRKVPVSVAGSGES